jgi:hypothetical protein
MEILEFSSSLEYPGILGSAIARVSDENEGTKIVDIFTEYYNANPIIDSFIR